MTGPVRVPTDDQVYRVRAIFLGPPGWSMPWHARYLAYAVFFAVFPLVWVTEFLIGYHEIIPVWAFCIALLVTKGVMQVVDHDLTLRALLRTGRLELHSWRRHKPEPMRYTNTRVDYR